MADKKRKCKIMNWLVDWFVPKLVGGGGNKSPKTYAVENISIESVAERVVANLRIEIEHERERGRSADDRLKAILNLSPIVITLILAIVSYLLSGKGNSFTGISKGFVLGFSFYVIFEFLLAVRFSIKGLRSRAYEQHTPQDLLPKKGENDLEYQKRMFQSLSNILETNQEVNNSKIDQMNLAHEATLNAIYGLFALFIALGIIVAFG